MKDKPLSPPKITDVWDGTHIPPLWLPDVLCKARGRVAILTRATKCSCWPEHKEDWWCGHYDGYGRDEQGRALFRSMKNAVEYATAAYRAGYRKMKGKHEKSKQ